MRKLLPVLFLVAASFAEDPPAPPKPPETVEAAQAPAPNPVAVITTSMGEIRVLLFADEAPATVENFLALAEGTKEWKDAAGETVKRPFYDGLLFHRVIKGFMIQGGCPKGDGSGDAGYKFKDEINAKSLGLDKVKVLDQNGAHPSMQLQSQEDFQKNVVMPLFAKMGITSQEDLDKRMEEVQKRVEALTVKEALENLGYVYEDTHASHAPKKGSLAMANGGPNTNGCQFFLNLEDTPWLTGRHTVFGEVIGGMDVLQAIGGVKVAGDRPIADVKIVSIRRLPPEEAAKAVAEAAKPEPAAAGK